MKCPRCGRTLEKISFGEYNYHICLRCGYETKSSRKIEEEFGSLDQYSNGSS